MKPQQQNTDVIGKSHVYVQKPNGEQINIPSAPEQQLKGVRDNDERQTAEKTPTTHSKEVADGEDA